MSIQLHQDPIHQLLATYSEDYFREVESLSWEELATRQQGRLASLAFGAGGVAFACWYAARHQQSPHLLKVAERWIVAVLRRQRGVFAYYGSATGPRATLSPTAFLYGKVGLYFVRGLVAHGLNDARTRRRAWDRLEESCGRPEAEPWDLYAGTAGALLAVSHLSAEVAPQRFLSLGRELSRVVLPFTDRRIEDGSETVQLGLGHGVAGAQYALLAWSAATGDDLPRPLGSRLEQLVFSALEDPAEFCPRESLRASVCNGFAGLAVLAARAYEVTGEPSFRQATLEAARLAVESTPDRPDLCCGRIGVAYGCLAAARLEPDGPWRRRAAELALSTLLVEPDQWQVSGLYGGEAALACLATDLVAGVDAAPPGFEPVRAFSGATHES